MGHDERGRLVERPAPFFGAGTGLGVRGPGAGFRTNNPARPVRRAAAHPKRPARSTGAAAGLGSDRPGGPSPSGAGPLSSVGACPG